ncbi:beta-lactamase/transpeptidase-like protein [Thelonectria olida]|uniref:Beta-lactamase/transpeptidase-like protein n=1 Tax=Thelonectria olida TaxID=1576542 RepID=A0A9P8VP64_9HYPO|nr:beta-lactamase/transpeptidase-like protein [Thelonectria olida]
MYCKDMCRKTALSLSLGVLSIHEAAPMFEFHHSPPNSDPRGVSEVNSNTVYRLASMTKLFTVLGVLRIESISLEDPVTKYLPELREMNKQAAAQDAINTVDWDSITLGALAAHQSGVGADYLVNLPGEWTTKGFPPADNATLLGCSGFFGQRPCNRTDFFAHFGKRPPVFAPFTTASYSNVGTILLGLVIEKVTNMTYEGWMQQSILNPVGMNLSFTSTPSDSLGFIPTNDTNWALEIGVEAPTGGLYSSISDLLALGRSILSYDMLSPARTRKWMKPLSGTSSISTFIGAPWEIYRSNTLTKDGRMIEFYTKAGDLFTYHTSIALIPDYDLVMVALVAGNEVGSSTPYQVIGDAAAALLPVIEQAGKAEAEAQYAGTYTDPSTNSSLTLSLDDGPGFSITNWQVRGIDVIATPLFGDDPAPNPPRVRLYPMNLSTSNQTAWRAIFEDITADEAAASDALLPWAQFSCASWGVLDRLVYQFQGRDSFVFDMVDGGEGEVAMKAGESVDLAWETARSLQIVRVEGVVHDDLRDAKLL